MKLSIILYSIFDKGSEDYNITKQLRRMDTFLQAKI